MANYKYIVSNKQGLHATNIMSLNRATAECKNRITLTGTKDIVNYKNVLALMSLGVGQGESLELTMEGSDEGQASDFLKGFMRTILWARSDRRP